MYLGDLYLGSSALGGQLERDLEPPAPPGDLSGRLASSTSVLLTWSASPEFDLGGYRVYYRDAGEQWSSPVAAMGAGEGSYVVSSLRQTTKYFFRLTAVDASGNESAASEIELNTTATPGREPVFVKVSRRPVLNWQFVLARANDMGNIGRLSQARNKQLTLVLNRPGSATFSFPLDDELASEIVEWKTCVKAIRGGVTRWSGPITKLSEKTGDMRVDVIAEGWMEEVYGRVLRPGQEQGMTFTNTGLDALAWALLNKANKQRAGVPSAYPQNADGTHGDLAKSIRPTHVSQGGVILAPGSTMPLISRSYAKEVSIGAEIQSGSDLENGYDMRVDSLTRQLKLYYPRIGQDRPEVIFAHRWGPRNVISVERATDGMRLCNRYSAGGPFGYGMAEDEQSMNDFGVMREEFSQLSDVKDINVLKAYAGAEVAIRRGSLVVHSLVPFPYAPNTGVPRLFDEYDLGDTVRLTVREAGRLAMTRQPVRLFGLTIDVDLEGNERITSVQTSPAT